MMVSDKVPRSASMIGEKLQISIPSRSSSISHASHTIRPSKQSSIQRHSVLKDDDRSSAFLDTGSNRTNTSSTKSSKMIRRSTSCSATSRKPPQPFKVQRWAGLTRSVDDWDGLRKDPELCVQNGDCQVHLYARGASRRNPSFCVPSRALRQKNCGAMLDLCYAQTAVDTSTGLQETRRLHSFHNPNRGSGIIELYIPAPEHASREDAFRWHLTTRNFFAFILGLPLVGHHMGQSFVDLLERMNLFRSGHVNNHQDFLEYADNQGYRDVVECTDYALASLFFAERYKLREVWIDAFAHCVGMNDSLTFSPEYALISRLTKALITRAYLELDIHLGRVAKALQSFLEDDFSPAHLGLAEGARNHLNRFQRFLRQFYVGKFGYWPPPKSASPFPKALYKSMFYDFQSLYDLLVDNQSSTDIASQKPASGGICVLQNVCHFDKRHKFTAQPHPLPLLPNQSEPQKTVRSLSSASHHKKMRDTHLKSAALFVATNDLSADVMNSKIVQAYLEFESTYAANSSQREEKVTAIDARKVRWLLIYGTLQYLHSALRAPNGVRDLESPEYPLCCLVAGQSSWKAETPASTPLVSSPTDAPRETDDYFGASAGTSFSIQPDCHREDYFTSSVPVRRNSTLLSPTKAVLPSLQPPTRAFGSLSSLSARSSRRNSTILKPTSHCAIIVHGYGDGLNQASTQESLETTTEKERANTSYRSSNANSLAEVGTETLWPRTEAPPVTSCKTTSDVNSRCHTRTRTPLLHTFQLDHMVSTLNAEDVNDMMSRSDSTSSTGSSVWTDGGSATSSKSSADGGRQQLYKASTAAHSGLLGGLISVNGSRVSLDAPKHEASTAVLSQKDIHPLLRTPSVQQEGFQFDFGAQPLEMASSTFTADSVGMAFSAPPSPPLHATSMPRNTSLTRTMSLTSEKTIRAWEPSTATSALAPETVSPKKSLSSDIFSGFISTPSELRDRYNSAIKRLENAGTSSTQYGDLRSSFKSLTHTSSVTKTSHATKMPSLRNRIWHDDASDAKKERRMSSFWRR